MIKNNRYRSQFLVASLFSFLLLYSNQPMVRNFERKDYKSGTQNWDIEQNESNILFFANNSGLLTFDGNTWNTYPIVNRTSVRSILHADNGLIFASTFNEFGYYKMQQNGSYLYTSLTTKLTKKPNGPNELYNIYKGDKNDIFFQSEKSIYKYNGKAIERLPFNEKIEASAYIANILFVANSQQGAYMLVGNMFVKIQGSEILQNKRVCSILPLRENKILFITNFEGTYLYDGTTMSHYDTGIDNFLKQNQVFCATTNGSKLAYGTVRAGVAIQDLVTKNVTFVNTFTGLQNNTVLSVKFDNQQNLWLGLDKGIDYVVLNSPVSNLFGSNNLYGAGYTSIQDKNTMYFGTNQGLYATSNPSPFQTIPPKLTLVKGMEGQVWGLTKIDNTLFCGDDQGAFVIDGLRATKIAGLQGTWSFKKLNSNPNMIVGCSYQGLFILKKTISQWKLSHFIKGGFNESSPMFEQDADGSIWFSHWQKGLFRLYLNNEMDSIVKVLHYDEQKGLPSNRNNTFFKVANQLIFSSERGVYSYNSKTDRMIPNEKWNKLFSSTPTYMRFHESPIGDVWCVSGSFLGLARKQTNDNYVMDSISYRVLQPKILAGFEHFNFVDTENVLLNTEDGFSMLSTQSTIAPKETFKVFISRIQIMSTKNSEIDSTQVCTYPTLMASFAKNQNSLRFQFVAPEYRSDNMVQYSYLLENYDDDWSSFSFANEKEYTKLVRGKYVLKVKARNLLQNTEATYNYHFEILPAWYESNWAIFLYVLLLIFGVFKLIIYVKQQSEKGAIEMEKRKEIEIQEHKKVFEAENTAKKKEIKELKNQQLQYELRHKAQELASSTMNLIRKNEILIEIAENINKTTEDIKSDTDKSIILQRLTKMERSVKQNIEQDKSWKKFEENFDLVYENYLKRLSESYPELNVTDKKICAYIKMDLSSKDMAPLLDMSVRSIETNRYRIRQKLKLDREVNMADFLQKF